MNEPTLNSAIPGSIMHKLGQIRRRKMAVQVASAGVAAVAVLLAAMGVAMFIDWLATLYDSRWRVVLTLAAFAAAVLTTVGWLALAWRRSLRWESVASDVDERLPQLEERWTTMTRLAPEDAANPQLVHPAMLRHVATEAARWEPQVDPEQIVSLSSLMKTMLGLTAITAVLAVAVFLDTRQTVILMRRFWLPGSSISATQLVNVPGNIVVGQGEPLALEAQIKGSPVERATLFLQDEAAKPRSISLVAHGKDPIEFSHRVRSVETPFAYRFRAGDGQTEWYTVAVAERPEIDKLRMTVTPPEYTGRAAKSFDKLPQRLAALESSELEIALRPDIPVTSVALRLGGDKLQPLTADADGWYRWKTTLEDGMTIEPILTESHGLTNRRVPKCQLSVYADKPPAVKVITPDDQMAVRPDDTIQITFTAQDDVGIGGAEMLVYDESTPTEGEPVPFAAIPIPLDGQAGQRTVQQTVELDLSKLGFEDGSEFSYEIRVREDRGGSPLEQVASTDNSRIPDGALRLANRDTATTPPGAASQSPNGTQANANPASSQASTSPSSAPSTSQTASSAAGQSNASQGSASQAGQMATDQSGKHSGDAPSESLQQSAGEPGESADASRVAAAPSTPGSPPGDSSSAGRDPLDPSRAANANEQATATNPSEGLASSGNPAERNMTSPANPSGSQGAAGQQSPTNSSGSPSQSGSQSSGNSGDNSQQMASNQSGNPSGSQSGAQSASQSGNQSGSQSGSESQQDQLAKNQASDASARDPSANGARPSEAMADQTAQAPPQPSGADARSPMPGDPATSPEADPTKDPSMQNQLAGDPSSSAASPNAAASSTAKSAAPQDAKSPQEPGPARTATTARRAISSRQQEQNPDEALANQMESSEAAAGSPADSAPSAQDMANDAKSSADQQAADQAKDPSANPSASNMANRPQSPNGEQQANNNQSGSPGNQQAGNQQPGNQQASNQHSGNQQTNPAGQQSPNSQQMASSSQGGQSSPSDQPPGDSMSKRSLDVPQESSSRRMRLKVDQWAGSFAGQQRAKLEMAISPELEALDQALAKAQRTARGVLDELANDARWQGKHDRDVSSAEKSTVEAQQVIQRLQDRSRDTPYAFIGLQVSDIGLAHVNPARNGFWKALESEGGDRTGSVSDAWQHLGAAREMVKELKGQYERSKREFELAERVERVKKMYRVYLENSQQLLQTQDSDPTRYGRKMVEFDLDEEYLARLQEVMEMRRDLRAELARILAEDPRLLRRFMDSLRNRTNSLREDLAELVANQDDLNREVRAWALVEEADRPRIGKILLLRQVQDASKLSAGTGELQSRYQAWLPLDRESKDADLAAATRAIQQVATKASELDAACQQCTASALRPQPPAEAGDQKADADEGSAGQGSGAGSSAAQHTVDVAPLISNGQKLYDELQRLELALRQLAAREENSEAATFAANRLVETRRLIADTSAWIRQMKAHQAGTYTRAAEVDQYRLAMKTDELAGKLGAIEQSLAGLLQRTDGSLPKPIADKAREFLTTLDKQASPNQLASVYALHNDQLPRAVERQRAAGTALTRAEKLYDELMRMTIEELDKMPVQDPIASLLDDPTLDELLAQLEQELPVQELLGIPQRPSNLQIIGDWLRPGGDNSLSMGGGSARMLINNQLRQDQQQMRQRLDQVYRRALARALKDQKPTRKIELPKAVKLSDWNQLVSRLGDDLRQGRDKAPPEQYRRAIEQYFSQVSGVVAEQEQATESNE